MKRLIHTCKMTRQSSVKWHVAGLYLQALPSACVLVCIAVCIAMCIAVCCSCIAVCAVRIAVCWRGFPLIYLPKRHTRDKTHSSLLRHVSFIGVSHTCDMPHIHHTCDTNRVCQSHRSGWRWWTSYDSLSRLCDSHARVTWPVIYSPYVWHESFMWVSSL